MKLFLLEKFVDGFSSFPFVFTAYALNGLGEA